MTAAEAVERLGIKRATLYAYVSRGKVRGRADGKGRRRRYLLADLERLAARRDARSGHGAVAAGALRWGEPVLDSAITSIDAGGPRYRGVPALTLARDGESYEEVADRLFDVAPEPWARARPELPAARVAALAPSSGGPLGSLALALDVAAMHDVSRFDGGREASLAQARRIVRGLACWLALPRGVAAVEAAGNKASIAKAVLSALGGPRTRAARVAVDRALILCADHELNPSTFTCRVAAAAGANLYGCVRAALATLAGTGHGGLVLRVEAFIGAIAQPEDVTGAVREQLREGRGVPGFGHRLYPAGDPRTPPLLELATELAPRNRGVRKVRALIDTMDLVDGARPSLEIGLVALAYALRLPPGAALGIFAVSRSAGWLAHAMEQREAGFLLRPRARYVGI